MNTRFIGEPITAVFDTPPAMSKKPGCPDGFVWNDTSFRVARLLEEWVDYGRRGRMAQNMQPEHAARAAQRGSWGVGRFYFRVQTENGRTFELYYDRAPKDADDRYGSWFLTRELLDE
ncbi:MAG: hypothetical protein H6659_02400 [Ardenticatenaceae bacterium]|nr:hypothetical protein [Ardenticatenaceae bacterium]